MRSCSRFAVGRAALAASALFVPAGPAAAGPPRALALSKVDDAAVERARAGATRKLQEPECQKLLDDFGDAEGRPLRQSLERWGLSAAEYVQMIAFLRGSSHRLCLRGNVALVSTPGFPRVYVCDRFAMTEVSEPALAETMVIHEMLHTLGLGENPPSSLEITKRVQRTMPLNPSPYFFRVRFSQTSTHVPVGWPSTWKFAVTTSMSPSPS